MNTTTEPTRRNGVDTETLFATINAVAAQPAAAAFRFRASNTWMKGTHSRSSVSGYFGAGQEHEHVRSFVFDADHPTVLVGEDNGPTPVELVLVALASCLTAGVANIAAARKVDLRSVESTVEGEIDLRGILGIDGEVRNGYQNVTVSFRIDADASPEKVRQIVEQSKARSAVLDIVSNGVPVRVDVTSP